MGKYRDGLNAALAPSMSDEGRAALSSDEASRWDFFFRHESNSKDITEAAASYAVMDLPLSTPLADAIAAAIDALLIPQGSARSGCFEVQNDAGIFSHENARRIDLSTPRKAAKVSFKTWDELN